MTTTTLTKSSLSLGLLALVLTALVGTSRASAQADLTCAPTARIDAYRLLRQLSIDLRGQPPSEAEYLALDAAGDVSPEAVQRMITSEEFYRTMRGYHRGLLSTGLAETPVVSTNRHLAAFRPATGAEIIYYQSRLARNYRGGNNTACVDREHTSFDANGHVVPLYTGYRGAANVATGVLAPRGADGCTDVSAGCRLDGWVRVHPYWSDDPAVTVRVCAYDAQAIARGIGTGTTPGPECNGAQTNRGCGCGPNLRYCFSTGATGSLEIVRDALEEEPLRIFERALRTSSASYYDAFTTPNTEVNGALAHYYRHAVTAVNVDSDTGTMPNVPFSDARYRTVERGSAHAGVLTTFAYTMRFASNRARANRFATAFYCEPFESPAGGLPPATDACSQNPDLSERCGCASCHQRLEPLAAHWGRWRLNQTYGYLDSTELPRTNAMCNPATCTSRTCMTFCNTYYVTPQNLSGPSLPMWQNQLQVVAWRTRTEANAIDQGPARLVEGGNGIDRMASCSVRNLIKHYLHRELTTEESSRWVPELVTQFRASNYRLQTVVRAIVNDERYRAIH